jgi:hypothetical protein
MRRSIIAGGALVAALGFAAPLSAHPNLDVTTALSCERDVNGQTTGQLVASWTVTGIDEGTSVSVDRTLDVNGVRVVDSDDAPWRDTDAPTQTFRVRSFTSGIANATISSEHVTSQAGGSFDCAPPVFDQPTRTQPTQGSVVVVQPNPKRKTTITLPPPDRPRVEGDVVKWLPARTIFTRTYRLKITVRNTGDVSASFVVRDVMPSMMFGFKRDGTPGAKIIGKRITLRAGGSYTWRPRFGLTSAALNRWVGPNCVELFHNGRKLDESCARTFDD